MANRICANRQRDRHIDMQTDINYVEACISKFEFLVKSHIINDNYYYFNYLLE